MKRHVMTLNFLVLYELFSEMILSNSYIQKNKCYWYAAHKVRIYNVEPNRSPSMKSKYISNEFTQIL